MKLPFVSKKKYDELKNKNKKELEELYKERDDLYFYIDVLQEYIDNLNEAKQIELRECIRLDRRV